MEELKAFAKLMRPRHTAQIVGIVIIVSIASHGVSKQSLCAIISALFLSISIYFMDDAYDYKSDQIVHSQRPIPQGLITIRQAYLAGAILLSLGILFASMLPFYQFVIFLVLSFIANAIIFFNLKSILRALLTASFIGALIPFAAFPELKIVLYGLIVALPHVGGSIAKDFIHSSGDRIQGLEPPPDWSKYLASAAFFLCAALAWLPKILNLVNWFYVPPIIATQISCLMLGVRVLKGHYQKVYFYGAIGMLSSLTAFLLGGI